MKNGLTVMSVLKTIWKFLIITKGRVGNEWFFILHIVWLAINITWILYRITLKMKVLMGLPCPKMHRFLQEQQIRKKQRKLMKSWTSLLESGNITTLRAIPGSTGFTLHMTRFKRIVWQELPIREEASFIPKASCAGGSLTWAMTKSWLSCPPLPWTIR